MLLDHDFDLYEPFCGFEKLNFTISHDYYLYKVLEKTKIPDEGLYLIRFHSFYAFHSPRNNIRGYTYYANDKDWKMLPLLKLLQKCDLYSKTRNINKPNSYYLDQDHHNHTANQSLNMDWQFIAELKLFEKIKLTYE